MIAFIIILVAAISNYTCSEHDPIRDNNEIHQDAIAYYLIDIPDSPSTLYIPPSTAGACATHLFSNNRNRNNIPYNLSDFLKNGKLIYTTNLFFTRHNTLTLLHLFTKPTHRLVSYGKLLI